VSHYGAQVGFQVMDSSNPFASVSPAAGVQVNASVPG
jgi:hypothetical protein